MDENRFKEAQQAYAAGDWRAAAKTFLAAADSDAVDNGPAFHQAGNALMKLRRYADAATVYQHALADQTYAKRGAVFANLGAAYLADGRYPEAEESYSKALATSGYGSPYKAMQGRAGALFEMRRFAEAAEAYRAASMDGGNPDPGKALNNLGLSYMALGKWAEAVDAYRAALRFDSYKGKGRCYANLGMAYVAGGMHDEAVEAFKTAVNEFGHALSPEADAAFKASLDMAREREVVEGWSTGEQPPVIEADPGSTVQFEAVGAKVYEPADEDVELFFNRTDEEMKQIDREARRAERDARRKGGLLGPILGIVMTALIVIGLLAGAWFAGLGWPSQSSTVKGLLSAYRSGKPIDGYWVAVPSSDVSKEMSALPPKYKDFSVDTVTRQAATSVVTVTVTLEQGAPIHYEISLSREGVGWKVDGIKYDWRSTGGGS